MKPSKRLIPVCALSTLLMACDANKSTSTPAVTVEPTAEVTTPVTTAPHNAAPLPRPGQAEIDLGSGKISIRATEVDELDLLEQIAASAGFDLLTEGIQWRTITVDIHTDSLHAALTELLSDHPYQIVYRQDNDSQTRVPSEVFVSPDLAPVTPSNKTKTASRATDNTSNKESVATAIDDSLPDPELQAQLLALKSESDTTRAAAAEEIEPTGEALIALTGLLSSDPSPQVRIATTRALEFSDDPLAIQALVDCLDDTYPAVIIECIKVIEHIGDSSNIAQLQPLLEHFDAGVRATATEAIENLQ